MTEWRQSSVEHGSSEVSWRTVRDMRLARLSFDSYEAYLSSPLWAAARGRYRTSDRPQACVLCSATDGIVLHHRTYERLGEEALDDLVPVCLEHHADVHVLEQRGEIDLSDVEALKSAVQAQEYRPIIEGRRRLFQEMDAAKRGDRLRKRSRQLRSQLGGAVRRAEAAGAEFPEAFDRLADAISEIERLAMDRQLSIES